MRIIHIIPNLKKGGAERLALDICIELSKHNGIKVCLISLSEQNDYKELSGHINCKVIPSKVIPSLTGNPKVQINELMASINEFNPDIIHSHLFEADLVSRWQLLKGIKYFSHCHDNMHQLQKFQIKDVFSKKRLTELYEKHLVEKQYLKCNNQFIAISKHTQSYFNAVLPEKLKQNIHLLPNAINFNKFYHKRTEPNELVLINVGSFVDKKNQQLIIPIVKSIHAKGISCKAIFLGDGKNKNKIEQQIKNEGLEPFFYLPGNVPAVEAWLKKASIYLHTAVYEPFGLVLLEAMASGLPIVTLNGGGNVDIIENGQNGYIIKDQDPELFANRILQIWENKALYKSMSAYAQEYAKQFDIKEYVDKLIKIYTQ